MPKVLILAYAFPPDSRIGAQRPARLCRYLPQFGIEPIVVTVEQRYYKQADMTCEIPAGVRIEYTKPIPHPFQFYAWWKKRGFNRRRNGTANIEAPVPQAAWRLRDHIAWLFATPDPEITWYWPALRCVQRIMAEERVDAIFSTSPPHSVHLIGRTLKRKYGIPWLMDLRDPWAGRSGPDAPSWYHRVRWALQSSCIRLSDVVVCTTDQFREHLSGSYPGLPREKFRTLRNGFEDVQALVGPKPAADGRKHILHLGELYGSRRVDTFCQAIQGLVSAGRLDGRSFQISFVGRNDSQHIDAARRAAPSLFESGCIQFLPQVPREAALSMMWSADLLVLVQGGFTLQVPAKFYEYLQTGRPIFAIARQGELCDLLRTTQAGIFVDPDDGEAIAAQFLEAWKMKPRPPQEVEQRWAKEFHFRHLAGTLAEWITVLTTAKNEFRGRVQS